MKYSVVMCCGRDYEVPCSVVILADIVIFCFSSIYETRSNRSCDSDHDRYYDTVSAVIFSHEIVSLCSGGYCEMHCNNTGYTCVNFEIHL